MTRSRIQQNVSIGMMCLLSSLTFQYGLTQIDTEFWFAAPSVTEDHGDRPVMLRISAFERTANVEINQPANPSFDPIRISVGANESQTISLTNRIDMIESWPANKVLRKGLLIVSDAPITVYYEVNSNVNPDIFSLKGRNALGKEFFVPAQNQWPNAPWYSPQATSSADIVATESQTKITITPSARTKAHAAGETFTITLNRGETYSLEARDSELSSKLTGTIIQSDKFIAITLKDDSNVFRPCLDLGGDQIVPTDILGTEYIVVKGFLDGGDRVFIQAIEDGTKVAINGGIADIHLDAGEMHNFRLSTDASHIKSNHPVYVLHATGFGCEIGMALLPKLECTGSTVVNFTRSTSENFGIILFTESGNEDAFKLNGSANLVSPDAFVTVSGSDGRYVAARLDLSSTPLESRALTAENSKGSFHLGTINGGSRTGCRYGYFSDFKTLKILAETSNICLGSELFLQATGSDHYEWFGSPTVKGISDPGVLVMPDTSTTYGVIGSNGSLGCLDTAFLKVDVFDWPKPKIEIDRPCINQPMTLTYTGLEALERIEWSINGDTIATGWQEPFEFIPTRSSTFDVTVRAINPAGCLVDTTFQIDVGGIELHLDSTFSVIRGNSFQLNASVLNGVLNSSSINWSPSSSLSCNDCLNPIASPTIETQYVITLADSLGCTYEYHTKAYVDSPVFIPNAFTPDNNGINDRFQVFADDTTLEELVIFDRWGSMVFKTKTPQQGWDGRINGALASSGVYLYILAGTHQKSKNSFVLNGTVNLFR